jgi:hypothetical protein
VTLPLVLLLTTFGATMLDGVVVAVVVEALLLLANGRALRRAAGPLDRRLGAGGVVTACGIFDRSGVRLIFDLDPLELPFLLGCSTLPSAGFLTGSPLSTFLMLLLYRVSKMPKNKNKRKSFFSFYFFPVK